MAVNGNGTVYKVAMGIVGLIFISIFIFMGNGIVDNDKVRASEDQVLEDKIIQGDQDIDRKSEERHSDVVQKVEKLNRNMNDNFRQLFVEIGKLQTVNASCPAATYYDIPEDLRRHN